MPQDDILLDAVQRIVPPGVLQRDPRVRKAVQRAVGIGHVPVVQKVVVQQRAAHQGVRVHPDAQAAGQRQRPVRDPQAVVIYADLPVLGVVAQLAVSPHVFQFICEFQNPSVLCLHVGLRVVL